MDERVKLCAPEREKGLEYDASAFAEFLLGNWAAALIGEKPRNSADHI